MTNSAFGMETEIGGQKDDAAVDRASRALQRCWAEGGGREEGRDQRTAIPAARDSIGISPETNTDSSGTSERADPRNHGGEAAAQPAITLIAFTLDESRYRNFAAV